MTSTTNDVNELVAEHKVPRDLADQVLDYVFDALNTEGDTVQTVIDELTADLGGQIPPGTDLVAVVKTAAWALGRKLPE
jgi:hypothetical protein